MSPQGASPEARQSHRVLLVREWDEQTSGSGCCGRLGSEVVGSLTERAGNPDPYARTRADMEGFGAVYRALRERYPEEQVELTVVDPRNAVWLAPAVWRDARRRGFSPRAALRQTLGGTASRALVCDGAVLISGEVPDPGRAVAAVEQDIAERLPAGAGGGTTPEKPPGGQE